MADLIFILVCVFLAVCLVTCAKEQAYYQNLAQTTTEYQEAWKAKALAKKVGLLKRVWTDVVEVAKFVSLLAALGLIFYGLKILVYGCSAMYDY